MPCTAQANKSRTHARTSGYGCAFLVLRIGIAARLSEQLVDFLANFRDVVAAGLAFEEMVFENTARLGQEPERRIGQVIDSCLLPDMTKT